MKIDRRVYRTRDGRLVWQGDPDAAFLAYPAGREVPESIAATIGSKRSQKPADKQAAKAEDKSGGSGLTVNRRPRGTGGRGGTG